MPLCPAHPSPRGRLGVACHSGDKLLAREFVLAGGSFFAADLSGTGELANTKVHVSLGVTYVGDLLCRSSPTPLARGSGHPRRRRWTRKGGSPVSSYLPKVGRQELATSTPLGAVSRSGPTVALTGCGPRVV